MLELGIDDPEVYDPDGICEECEYTEIQEEMSK